MASKHSKTNDSPNHSQAIINLINAAVVAAHNIEVKLAYPLNDVEIACLKQLKRAVAEYKETNQAKQVDPRLEEVKK